MSFILTPDILKIGADAFDSLIDIRNLGKTCRFVFAPIFTPCTCVNSSVGNVPTVVGQHGGPMNYPMSTVCPLCSGKGQISQDVYQDIVMLINWEPKTFDPVWEKQLTRLPEGIIQAKGYIQYMPVMSQCQFMIPDILMSAYQNYTFRLVSEPISAGNIIKRRYFTSIWERT